MHLAIIRIINNKLKAINYIVQAAYIQLTCVLGASINADGIYLAFNVFNCKRKVDVLMPTGMLPHGRPN